MKTPKSSITRKQLNGDTCWVVIPVWDHVDRASTSYSCGKGAKGRVLAERLAAAFEAGACYSDAHIRTDINAQTYVSFDFDIRMRCADADLKKIGY